MSDTKVNCSAVTQHYRRNVKENQLFTWAVFNKNWTLYCSDVGCIAEVLNWAAVVILWVSKKLVRVLYAWPCSHMLLTSFALTINIPDYGDGPFSDFRALLTMWQKVWDTYAGYYVMFSQTSQRQRKWLQMMVSQLIEFEAIVKYVAIIFDDSLPNIMWQNWHVLQNFEMSKLLMCVRVFLSNVLYCCFCSLFSDGRNGRSPKVHIQVKLKCFYLPHLDIN